MATSISWTAGDDGSPGEVWNCLRGCTRVSPGCGVTHAGGCYAERMAYRFSGKDQPYEGLVKLTNNGPRWTGVVRCIEEKLTEPLQWKKPRRIFVNSMSDVFHEAVPDEFISRMFAVMALAPQHTFQLLTKRADRMESYLREMSSDPEAYCFTWADEWYWEGPHRWQHNAPSLKSRVWPLPNVHLGVSVEDQKRADERIPHLLRTPASVRWLSCEPLLESVDLSVYVFPPFTMPGCKASQTPDVHMAPSIDWVVIGCESGPGMRSFEGAWARKIVADCKAAGVPVHVKQIRVGGKVSHDPAQWPVDLRVREAADAIR